MIENLLQESKETQCFLGFNMYGADAAFYCGYVLDFNDDFVIIKHISKYGLKDGFLIHKLSDIKYIESETDYLKGLKLLTQNQSSLRESFRIEDGTAVLDQFITLFESMIGNKDYLIKIEFNNDDLYYGFLEWCDDDYFSIINIDNDGSVIGKAIFKFEDMRLYWIDDQECRRRQLLYRSKNTVR